MSAYLIVDTLIENPEEYEKYKKLAKPIAEKYGGIYRVRGGEMDVRETDMDTNAHGNYRVSGYGFRACICRLRGVRAG
jgi:uncharacterized protein (DUF1330 family)